MQVKLIVTLPLFQPEVFADGDAVPVTVGGVRSTFMLDCEELAELPALSRQTPVTDCPAPSPSVESGGDVQTPERASVHVKLTVTVTLFHPFRPGPGDFELVIEGGVLSILIPETVPEPVLPALSMHVALRDCPVSSAETS